jgi:hypothetical protein
MIIGTILLVIPVVGAVIAALGVYVRFAMGSLVGGDMIFPVSAGGEADPEEEAGTAVPEAPVAALPAVRH